MFEEMLFCVTSGIYTNVNENSTSVISVQDLIFYLISRWTFGIYEHFSINKKKSDRNRKQMLYIIINKKKKTTVASSQSIERCIGLNMPA